MSRSVPYFKIRQCQAYYVQATCTESILLSSFDFKCWQTFWVNLSSTTGRESSWLTSSCFIPGCLKNTTVSYLSMIHQCDWGLPICSLLSRFIQFHRSWQAETTQLKAKAAEEVQRELVTRLWGRAFTCAACCRSWVASQLYLFVRLVELGSSC